MSTIRAKYDSTCIACGGHIRVGESMHYNRGLRLCSHEACGEIPPNDIHTTSAFGVDYSDASEDHREHIVENGILFIFRLFKAYNYDPMDHCNGTNYYSVATPSERAKYNVEEGERQFMRYARTVAEMIKATGQAFSLSDIEDVGIDTAIDLGNDETLTVYSNDVVHYYYRTWLDEVIEISRSITNSTIANDLRNRTGKGDVRRQNTGNWAALMSD